MTQIRLILAGIYKPTTVSKWSDTQAFAIYSRLRSTGRIKI